MSEPIGSPPRCTCARDGHARACPIHTQADFDAAELPRWRYNREPGWFDDVGYAMENVLAEHRYQIEDRGSKPDDPGWHTCSCGWEGYWSDFHPHLVDHLRRVVKEHRHG